jgi:hypothetical protein
MDSQLVAVLQGMALEHLEHVTREGDYVVLRFSGGYTLYADDPTLYGPCPGCGDGRVDMGAMGADGRTLCDACRDAGR